MSIGLIGFAQNQEWRPQCLVSCGQPLYFLGRKKKAGEHLLLYWSQQFWVPQIQLWIVSSTQRAVPTGTAEDSGSHGSETDMVMEYSFKVLKDGEGVQEWTKHMCLDSMKENISKANGNLGLPPWVMRHWRCGSISLLRIKRWCYKWGGIPKSLTGRQEVKTSMEDGGLRRHFPQVWHLIKLSASRHN